MRPPFLIEGGRRAGVWWGGEGCGGILCLIVVIRTRTITVHLETLESPTFSVGSAEWSRGTGGSGDEGFWGVRYPQRSAKATSGEPLCHNHHPPRFQHGRLLLQHFELKIIEHVAIRESKVCSHVSFKRFMTPNRRHQQHAHNN